MKLSVIIITLNEELNIARCIDSVKEIADEIVIVDSGSTDKTESIVLSKNAKFHNLPWMSYGLARNSAADLASYDWVLALDADEALSSELLYSIKTIKSKEYQDKEAFSFNRLTNYCDQWIRHSGWYPDTKTRIYNKHKTSWNDAIVHEALENISMLHIHHLKGDLLHYSYYSRKDHIQRADKYSRLAALKLHTAGKSASPFKPVLSMIAKFVSKYFLKLGFLDGKAGYDIAKISAKSNKLKYEELRRLNQNKDKS